MGITGSKEHRLRRKIGKRRYAEDVEDDGVKYVSTRTMTVTSKHRHILVSIDDLVRELMIVGIHKSVVDIQTTDHKRTWKITYESEETMERNLHTLKSPEEEHKKRFRCRFRLKPKPSWQLGSLRISGLFMDTQDELDKLADSFKVYVNNPRAYNIGHEEIEIVYDGIRRTINTNIVHKEMLLAKVVKTSHQSKSIVDVIEQLKTTCPDKFYIKNGLIAHECKTGNCQNNDW